LRRVLMSEQQKPFEEQAADWLAAIEHMRGQVKQVFEAARKRATPAAYSQALVDVRTIQDSLEEYVSLAIVVKGTFSRASSAAQGAYDEVWAAEADRDGRTSVRRDMEGPRERYARHDVKVFGQLREWRQSEQRLSLAQEVLDTVWLRYRAVNATREDLLAILRSYAFESSLDR
jgi:hypothetical protein